MKKQLFSHASFVLLACTAMIFSGCSSKKYFEPEQTFSVSGAATAYGDEIVDQSRDGATLKSGRYIGKSGISSLNLGEGYRFLSESGSYVLASNIEGKLKIINKRTGAISRTVNFEIPIVSATIHNGVVAYILNDNTFGLYRVSSDKKLVESKSEKTFAIDTRAATPMFIENLAVIPMLDGKLIIISVDDTDNANVVYLSSEDAFNNVIYLSRMGNTMIAATPQKVITIGDLGENEYRANVSDVTHLSGSIYLFTKEGEIIKMDASLSEKARKKFKYVHFSAISAYGGRIFALDQKGSLIVLNTALNKYKIYDVGEVDKAVFMKGAKLYKDGKIIDLSKLGYQ